jgi:hypothetical protein
MLIPEVFAYREARNSAPRVGIWPGPCVFTCPTAIAGGALLEGFTRDMNTIRRDGRDDTGEQDVRELRQRFAGEPPMPPEAVSEPHVRHKEDVPHEHAIPDFYGLQEPDEVDTELMALVDEGVLNFGWDPEQQEFVYWLREDEPALVKQPDPAPKPRSRRAKRSRRPKPLYRRTMLTLVASLAPFVVGMTTEAALDQWDHRHKPTMDQPDIASDDLPVPTATPTPTHNTFRPTRSAYQDAVRHAKVTTSPTVEKPGSYVGKHRKVIGNHLSNPSGKPKKDTSKPKNTAPASPTPSGTVAKTTPLRTAPSVPDEGRGAVQEVVHNVLAPVETLLK